MPIHHLKQEGIRGIIFDLDNTLLLWHEQQAPRETLTLIENLKAQGFSLCILSNGYSRRVQTVAHSLQIPCVCRALKPLRRGFKQALQCIELKPEEVAVIGDQLYTDVLGGNRSGCFTIWIPPQSKNEFVGTRLTRILEKWTVQQLYSKNLIKGVWQDENCTHTNGSQKRSTDGK